MLCRLFPCIIWEPDAVAVVTWRPGDCAGDSFFILVKREGETMSIRADVLRLRKAWTLLLLLALVVVGTGVRTAPVNAQDDKGHWNNIHLIYTTDIKGKIEPCG